MKLLLCPRCSDVFKLDYAIRTCKCGQVKGRYIDDTYAEVTPNAVSIALGNGDLLNTTMKVLKLVHAGADLSMNREDFQEVGKLTYAWIRPNEGPGNPHCKVNKDL